MARLPEAGFPVLRTLGAILVVLAAGLTIPRAMAALGLDFTDSDAAVLASVVGAAITMVGVLFNRSYDQHKKAAVAASSAAAKERQRVETIIRAVALQSGSDGKSTPETQQAASLFALATLGELQFALLLLRQMWPARRVSGESPVWLVNRGLESDGEVAQMDAAQILRDNAERSIRAAGSSSQHVPIRLGRPTSPTTLAHGSLKPCCF